MFWERKTFLFDESVHWFQVWGLEHKVYFKLPLDARRKKEKWFSNP